MTGVQKIKTTFDALKSEGKIAFVPYICAGDPDLATTERLVLALEESGCDMIELGIPFSDPVADGPTIQRGSSRALASGTTLRKVIAMVERLRGKTAIPILFMSYLNPPFRYGLRDFFRDARSAGVDGLIIPDLPPDESPEYLEMAEETQIATVFLAAPTSSEKRLKIISDASTGFVYCVSLVGVTGARKNLSDEVQPLIARLRKVTAKPLGVGFGISRPEHVREVARFADAAIVGSAIVKTIENAIEVGVDPVESVSRLTSDLASAAHERSIR